MYKALTDAMKRIKNLSIFRNNLRPSVDDIFWIILSFNSDFLGYRRIRHVQQIFHEKNLFFKNRELRNYRSPSVDNIFQIIFTFSSDFLGYRRIRHVQQFFHEKKLFFKKIANYEIISARLSTIFFKLFWYLMVISSVTDELDMYKGF